ncbi:MAG: hypothetical protein EB084_11495 [Proteobacteria bacterium]|nr:hypothetical protein [Pseudomonadota bacterium]
MPSLLDVTVHPARARPVATVGLVVYLCATSMGLGQLASPLLDLSPSAWSGLLTVVFLALLHRWFLPTRYRLDESGFEVRCLTPRHYPYARFRSCTAQRRGCWLSPYTNPRRFDSFRGLFVPLDETEASARLHALLREKIDGRPAHPA